MATPKVRVSLMEAQTGHLITCSKCPQYRTVRACRLDADLAANAHLRSHGKPHPDDERAAMAEDLQRMLAATGARP